MHGHTTAHGDSTDGIITAAGTMTDGSTVVSMILGIMEVSTTRGTTEALGDSMTLGTMVDGTAVGMATHIMPDGMVD